MSVSLAESILRKLLHNDSGWIMQYDKGRELIVDSRADLTDDEAQLVNQLRQATNEIGADQ